MGNMMAMGKGAGVAPGRPLTSRLAGKQATRLLAARLAACHSEVTVLVSTWSRILAGDRKVE